MFTRDSVIISRNIKTPLTSISRAVGNILQLTFNAPYNLTVEFKMTNRLELNWELDGVVDEQRYYCSEAPIDPNNLLVAKAILAGDVRTYVDTDIDVGKTYYARIGSVKNGVEKVSSQVIADTVDYNKYTAYFRLDDFLDKKGGANLTPIGNTLIIEGTAYFDGSGDWLQRPDTISTTFGTGNLTVECEFKCGRIGTHTYDQALIDNFINTLGGWQLGLTSAGNAYLYFNSPNKNAIVSQLSYSDGVWHKLKWTRSGNLNTLYVDNISVGTYLDQRDFTQKSYVAIGAQASSRNQNYDFKGWIRNVGYAKQVL